MHPWGEWRIPVVWKDLTLCRGWAHQRPGHLAEESLPPGHNQLVFYSSALWKVWLLIERDGRSDFLGLGWAWIGFFQCYYATGQQLYLISPSSAASNRRKGFSWEKLRWSEVCSHPQTWQMGQELWSCSQVAWIQMLTPPVTSIMTSHRLLWGPIMVWRVFLLCHRGSCENKMRQSTEGTWHAFPCVLFYVIGMTQPKHSNKFYLL